MFPQKKPGGCIEPPGVKVGPGMLCRSGRFGLGGVEGVCGELIQPGAFILAESLEFGSGDLGAAVRFPQGLQGPSDWLRACLLLSCVRSDFASRPRPKAREAKARQRKGVDTEGRKDAGGLLAALNYARASLRISFPYLVSQESDSIHS